MGVRVLIVDDSVVLRKIVERALRHFVPNLAEVVHAANGLAGLAALETAAIGDRPLDLILCDLHMPYMNGLEFLLEKQRRKLAHGVPVVMITADTCDPQVQRAVAAGAQGNITKPFTLEEFRNCAARLLPKHPVPARLHE